MREARVGHVGVPRKDVRDSGTVFRAKAVAVEFMLKCKVLLRKEKKLFRYLYKICLSVG